MTIRRVKFVWAKTRGEASGPWRLGVWSVRDLTPGSRVSMLTINLRGVAWWCAGAAFAAYLAATTALYVWLQRSPYNLVRWTDTVLLPVRFHHIQELRGRAMIQQGMAALREKRWAEARAYLRGGLHHYPHDLRAREELAQFDLILNERAEAMKVLTEDLGWGYPGRSYLTSLFQVAAQGEDYEVVIGVCNRFLPNATTDREWLLTEKVRALIGAGRSDEALKLTEAEGLQASATIKELRVMALLELRRSDEALDFLTQWGARAPEDQAQVLRLQVRAYREAGRIKKMDTALEAFRTLSPTDPRAYIYGVVQRYLAGEHQAAATALDDYFARFAADPNSLVLASNGLTEAKATPLVARCAREAAEHGFVAKPFQMYLLQSQMTTGDWNGALRTIAAARTALQNSSPAEQFTFAWMELVVTAAARPAEAPTAKLLEFLQHRAMPMRVYRQTTEALIAAGRWSAAHRALELGHRVYPASRVLARLGEQVDAALKAAEPPKAEFAGGPSAALLIEGKFFKQLAADEEAGQWHEAAQAIAAVRAARPVWLSRRDTEVLDAQMRVAMHTGDMLALIGAAQLYLDGSVPHASRVATLARELGDRGARQDGENLVNEILRKNPGFPPALRLLREWHPPPPKEKKP